MEIVKIEVSRPDCSPGSVLVSARCEVDRDLSELLPYLNATQDKPQYYPKTPYLRFAFEGHPAVIEGPSVRVYGFAEDAEAREAARRLVGAIAAVHERRSEIEPDIRAYNPPTMMDLFKLLPKQNGCGKCGCPACMAFAAALLAGSATADQCPSLAADRVEQIKGML